MEDNLVQSTGDSILDRVLTQKHSEDIEQFSPLDVVARLFKVLTPREEEILRRRYGLHGKPAETLEHIGAQYSVTRERIRQIESSAIQKLHKHHDTSGAVRTMADAVTSVLDQHGGVIRETSLLAQLVSATNDQQTTEAATLFILRNLLSGKVRALPEDQESYASWQLTAAPVHLVRETVTETERVLQEAGHPLPAQEVLTHLRATAFGSEHKFQLTDEAIFSYIDTSKRLARNPYDEYGLASWGTVVPKRMNDKIYLVLKKAGKPLHFNDITRLINETKFDHRTAYPPTVHNELILNDRYVLVGRGIYALKEWGYKPGVVADILVDILQRSAKPLTRDELVADVLKQRVVKRNTIHLALTNRKRFQKHPDGTYSLTPNPAGA